ncbi:MAG: hypothetical protein Wins2KO_04140 [Winogradskyella sp.]
MQKSNIQLIEYFKTLSVSFLGFTTQIITQIHQTIQLIIGVLTIMYLLKKIFFDKTNKNESN